MIKKSLCAAFLLLSCTTLHADSDDFEGPQVNLRNTHWEFGLQTGAAIPIGNKSSSIQANNSAFLISDPADIGEDEFAENGFPSPDFTAQSKVVADRQPSFYVGTHLYYRLFSWVGIGVEGSANLEHSEKITQDGAFHVPIYKVRYVSGGEQLAPAIRFGSWLGNIRPYGMIGAGPYFLNQKVTAELLDPDDADHPPVTAADENKVYFSTIWGGGIDINFLNQGSIGLAVQYQRIFSPGNNIQYFIPSMRFDYHF